jgi:WD40 repeat protein
MKKDSLPRFGNMVKIDQHSETETENGDDRLNPIKGLPHRKTEMIPTTLIVVGPLCLLGYEDGLITCWDLATSQLVFPLIGHSNRVNHMLADEKEEFIYSSANDCTVRQWNIHTGVCHNMFKFADPVTVTKLKQEINCMFTACWDKMIRVVDLKRQVVAKSFIASKETIKEIVLTNNLIIVAGCEPIIRAFTMDTGKQRTFMGHKGWVYCLMVHGKLLFSGGDDNIIRVWDLETTFQLEALTAHRNGVTSLALCNGDLYSSSFDHYIIHWDLPALLLRINEME